MSPKTLREYGLEYINEIAKDRELAQQEIGVRISGLKSTLISQGTQHFTYKNMEEFVRLVREETAQVVDHELTRITIKSLGRIREIIEGDTKFIQKITNKIDEEDIDRFKSEIVQLKRQLEEKNTYIKQLEVEYDDNRSQYEKRREELNKAQIEIKKFQLQLQSLKDQNELSLKRFNELLNELAAKEALIQNLKQNEKLHEKDIQEALASIAEIYKTHENYYQRMLEENVQQRMKEIQRETDLEIEEIQSNFDNTKKYYEGEIKHLRKTISRIEDELRLSNEERIKLQEKLTETINERTEENLLLDYTRRLLSSHPLYASILILLNLGGSLDLPTMARSVGAHPIKLRAMLEEFVTKGLISISSDDPPTISVIMTQ